MSESFSPTPPNHPFSRPFFSMPLAELGAKLFNPKIAYRPKILEVQKRIRGVLGGKVIFDSTNARLVWEHKWFPQYWIPKDAFIDSIVDFEKDKPISGIDPSTSRLSVKGGRSSSASTPKKSVSALLVPTGFNTPLAGLVKLDFNALDAWYEEQSQILYHPKDPFHRVDCLPSDRHVKIEIDGVVLADTKAQGGVMSLWETGLPGRWYLPRTAVNWEHLTPSETHTGCPYKGEASYYNVVIGDKEIKDAVWWYKSPIVESAPILGMLCFYPDKVDMWLDGEKQDKIAMPFAAKPKHEEHEHIHEHEIKQEEENANGYKAACNC